MKVDILKYEGINFFHIKLFNKRGELMEGHYGVI